MNTNINKSIFLLGSVLSCTACGNGEKEANPNVIEDLDITYAQGLAHDATSTDPFEVPLLLDVYYPADDSTNRPVLMFIHGGGFTGGIKHKPEIIEMAEYYAERGWVFVSIDYRTTEELGSVDDMSLEEVTDYYTGIAPQEWVLNASEGSETTKQLQQSIAMYAAQRDSKAALRWIVANASTYNIDIDYISVGGASAGAITTMALGISELEDFRDEISMDDDPTLSTTNLDATYEVQSMVYFWGSKIKLDVFEMVYGLDRFDANDPELFMAHGDAEDPVTPYEGSLEVQDIYDSLGIHSELVTLEGEGHGAWDATVDGKGLYELSYDFLVERQGLNME